MRIAQKLRDLFGVKRYETMTLGQLVTLVVDNPTAANQEAFFGRLLFSKVGARAPTTGLSLPSGKHVTTEGENVRIPSTRGPDGNVYLLVCCDIPAMWAEFPEDRYFELDARVVLEMAASNGTGVIFQNMLDGKQSWAAVPKEHVADILSGRYAEKVVLPPGHKVFIVEPAPVPHLGRCESGVWIAELGNGVGVEGIISRVRQLATEAQRTSVIWIVQPMVFESSSVFDAVVSALASIVRESTDGSGHVVVVPHAEDRHLPQLRRLKQAGVAVHYSGPHGECFVEVHRPDGIVVGMPGRALT
jgi:hypothetical protein